MLDSLPILRLDFRFLFACGLEFALETLQAGECRVNGGEGGGGRGGGRRGPLVGGFEGGG